MWHWFSKVFQSIFASEFSFLLLWHSTGFVNCNDCSVVVFFQLSLSSWMHLTVKSACWHSSISWGSAPPSGFNSVGWKLELPSSCKKPVQEKQSKSKNILKLVIINRQRNIDTTKVAQLIQLQELRSHFRMVLMGHEAALCRCGSVFIIAGSGSNLNTC